jgi:hypothetical protein
MEEGFGAVVLEFVKQFGWGIFALLFVLYQFVAHWDVFKNLFAERDRRKNEEREQLSEDTQRFIDNIERDAVKQREWRIADVERYERIITQLRDDCSKKDEVIISIERGNARLRHALNNALTAFAGLQYRAKKAGLPVEPFKVDEFLAIDPDYYKHLKDILGDD